MRTDPIVRRAWLLLALGALACTTSKPPAPEQPPNGGPKVVLPANPKPWEAALPYEETPKGLKGIKASDCAECHQDVVDEWKESAHGAAYWDPQFQIEWKKDGLWLCSNCHTPLENQQPVLVSGFADGDVKRPVSRPNPRHDPALEKEGLTCAVCHVRGGAIISTRTVELKEHPVRGNPAQLSHEWCTRCHNAQAVLGGSLTCAFNTGDDWLSTGLKEEGFDCISCHLPPTERANPDGTTRPGRHHAFLGAGIPKSVELPSAARSGLVVEIHTDERGYQRGKPARVKVHVTNQIAGHSVPTGDVERFVIVRFRLPGPKGETLWQHEERYGEVWEWWPEARRLSTNRIKRGETRVVELDVPLPADAKAPELEVSLENHRMTPATKAAMKVPDSYPLMIPVWTETYPLPLKGKGKAARVGSASP